MKVYTGGIILARVTYQTLINITGTIFSSKIFSATTNSIVLSIADVTGLTCSIILAFVSTRIEVYFTKVPSIIGKTLTMLSCLLSLTRQLSSTSSIVMTSIVSTGYYLILTGFSSEIYIKEKHPSQSPHINYLHRYSIYGMFMYYEYKDYYYNSNNKISIFHSFLLPFRRHHRSH